MLRRHPGRASSINPHTRHHRGARPLFRVLPHSSSVLEHTAYVRHSRIVRSRLRTMPAHTPHCMYNMRTIHIRLRKAIKLIFVYIVHNIMRFVVRCGGARFRLFRIKCTSTLHNNKIIYLRIYGRAMTTGLPIK